MLAGLAVALVGVVVLAAIWWRDDRSSAFSLGHGTRDIKKHTLEANKYVQLFSKEVGEGERLEQYETVVNSYYDLATDFYEYGWGTSFHFAQRQPSETLVQSLARHEHFLALKLGISAKSRVLDVGCGVGGPAREIARFSGAAVTGLNNNAYQVSRATILTLREKLEPQNCNFVKGDFMRQPFQDNVFDAAYAIEATCHAPDRVGCYAEILRVTKPGGLFVCYEWCTTDRFDGSDEHRRIVDNIQVGNGLPGVQSTRQVLEAAREAGWEIVEFADLAEPKPYYPVPWYEPLAGGFSIRNFRTTRVGIWLTSAFCYVFETLRVLPRGTYDTQQFLIRGAEGLVAGGKSGTFTPMFFFLGRKPSNGSSSTPSSASTRAGRSRSRSARRNAK